MPRSGSIERTFQRSLFKYSWQDPKSTAQLARQGAGSSTWTCQETLHFNIRIIIIILYTSPRAKFFIWYIVWRSFFDPRWAASSGTKKRVWNGVSRKHKEMVKWFDVRIKARTWRVALFHSNSRSNLRATDGLVWKSVDTKLKQPC